MILVTAKKDYADEFDVCFLKIFNDDDWNLHLQKAENCFDKYGFVEVYFGTNEAIEYSNFAEYKKSFKVQSIPEQEAEFIKKYIYPSKYSSYFGNNILIDTDDEE